MMDNSGWAYGCKHIWVERTAIIKEILKHSVGNSSNPVYFNKLRFEVCVNCAEIRTSLNQDDEGLDDSQVR